MAFPIHWLFRRRQAAWWTLVMGLTVTAAVGWEMHREAVKMDRQRLLMRVSEIQSQLDSRLEKSEMLLHNLRDYLMLSGENRNPVFLRWCYENGLSINCPWIHGIAVATNRYEAPWREELPNPAETWTADDRLTLYKLAREHKLDCHLALRSLVKNQGQFLADYDLQVSFNDRIAPLAIVARESRLRMGERRVVMLDANSNAITGTLFFVPVYRSEVANLLALPGWLRQDQYSARWLHLTAAILAPVDFQELAQSVWDGSPSDLGMELFASTNQTAATWLNISEDVPRAADPEFKAYLTHRQLWPMYGQVFSIFFHTTPLFEAQSPRRLAKTAVAAGTVLTLLATALVGVSLRARNRQELMTEQIREARDALAAAQRERERFSRDLHDGTIQSLYAVQLGLEQSLEKVQAEPAAARRELSAVRRELDGVIAEIRRFITAEAQTAEPVDFEAVLATLARRVSKGTAARIALRCEPGAAPRLGGEQAVQLAGIAREALSNSVRHGKPNRVELVLRAEGDAVFLEIADDGAGFDPMAGGRTGVGISSMTARSREMGGRLEIQSAPGKGTRVVVRVRAMVSETEEPEELDDADDES